jgi:hypothetical protein
MVPVLLAVNQHSPGNKMNVKQVGVLRDKPGRDE